MSTGITRRTLYGAAFALLIVSNVFILGGVWLNRTGEPESEITMTERELPLSYWGSRENSGLSLQLRWSVLGRDPADHYFFSGDIPEWLDTKKLEALGFDTASQPGEHKFLLSRHCFVVLEYDGAAYREALRRVQASYDEAELKLRMGGGTSEAQSAFKRLSDRLESLRTSDSRLFAVDAGADPKALREQYPDRHRFAIAGAVVQPFYQDKPLSGYIERLDVDQLHISLGERKRFDLLRPEKTGPDSAYPPRYAVRLSYGSRLEPWIVSVADMPTNRD